MNALAPTLALLALLGAVAPAHAQLGMTSCPAADSLIPADLPSGKPSAKYDRFTDSTRLERSDTRVGMRMAIEATFPGELFIADSTGFAFRYRHLVPQLTRTPITTESATLNAQSVLYLLADRSERMALDSAVSYSREVTPAFLEAGNLVEHLEYRLTLSQVAWIGRASRLEIKAGDLSTTLSKKISEAARYFVRASLCPVAD